MTEEKDPFSQYGTTIEQFPQFQEVDYVGLLNNKQLSDVAFIVEGNRFYAHKSILCSRSKYFDKLLRGTFTQFNGMELEIEIRDSSIIFYKVLQFIYTGSVGDLKTLDEYVVLGLLSGCVLYELDSLQPVLEKHIGENLLTVSNVCTVWRLALETGSSTLAQKCEEYFRKYSSKITQLPDFTEQMWEPIDLDSFITESESQQPGFTTDNEFLVQSFLSAESEDNNSSPEKKQELPVDYDSVQEQDILQQSLIPPQQGILQQHLPIAKYQMYTNTVPLVKQEVQTRQSNNPQSQDVKKQFQAALKAEISVSKQGTTPLVPQTTSNWINIYSQSIEGTKSVTFNQPRVTTPPQTPPQLSPGLTDDSRPPPPSYKTLAAKQKRLPMLQGPIWAKALEKMNTLIDLSRELIGADIGTLFLHDPITNELYSHVAHPEPVDIAIPAHLGIAGACFTTNKCINSPAAYTDTRFYSGIDRQTGAPTLAILAVPVPSESGKILGVVELLNKKRPTEFTEENEKELKTAARMVGRIVEKATLEVKNDIEKKGLKRIHMFTIDESRTKRPRTRRRDSIPVFHFKQMTPPIEKSKKLPQGLTK